ncbi:MAG: glycerol-3-phosphate dehydrogenase subunit GlpB [Bacteroidales bacterium]|jgi:glycerol-3-phosphate dehydrogenase subunit B|nr:glycerol-3-phosphate dehydrogenase subunit GlpB [Bacteroidales bacterium]MCI1786138.1 glycerol-3-phosphate dehydrogenase subunit GlpB [Bacteroidales bacterium]
MKYDTIIIGGGLSGLVCGISLAKRGSKCVIVSAGQNALNFSSGTFGLLSRLPDGRQITSPLEAIGELDENHPYRIIGEDKISEYAGMTAGFFEECGIKLHGNNDANGYVVTPTGDYKPAWLAMEDITIFPEKQEKIGEKVLVVNFKGYLDFNSAFVANAFEKSGSSCRMETVSLEATERLRRNPTEMRAVNIARVLDNESVLSEFAEAVKKLIKDEDVVVLPAVFGLNNAASLDILKNNIGVKTLFVGTMPPSIPGVRTQMLLKRAFEGAGGTFLMGDEVTGGEISGHRVLNVKTVNLGEVMLEADNFVLSSGNFFSKGLIASPEKVYEPVFDLDVDYLKDRSLWYDQDFFRKQDYMGFGVKVDSSLHALKGGDAIDNLYVTGSILAGTNQLYEGCGAGVAIFSAFYVADSISGKKEN